MRLGQWGRGAARSCALLAVIHMVCAVHIAHAQEGTVRIPLAQYEQLTGTHGDSGDHASAYAFRPASVNVSIDEDGSGQASALVTVSTTVNVLTEQPILIPLAAAGIALRSATEGGQPLALVSRGGSIYWPTEGRGEHALSWSYRADVRRYGEGRVLALSLPEVSSHLTLTVPGSDRGVTVVPASDVTVSPSGAVTVVDATLPASGAVQVAWREPGGGGFTLSRAQYRGRLDGDVVRFEAELVVDLESGELARVPLFPATLALEEVRVDRAEAAIAEVDGSFVVPVRGRGRHRIEAAFQVPLRSRSDGAGEGLPGFDLTLTPTPVSRFELAIPGERDVEVTPHTGVTTTRTGGRSVATFHVPMSSAVSVRWSEAVPDDGQEVETSANASVVHVVRPDDGVLNVRAYVSYEITRGAMSRAELSVPAGVQINSVESPAGVVSDWRMSSDRVLSVFLDRAVEGSLALEIEYERAWPVRTRTTEAFEVPLLRADAVNRQRGMVALLQSRELTLDPREEDRLTRVGDNLLPTEVRDRVPGTVAHTWRYLDEAPRLIAIGAVREPEPARFDAQLDTLVSLGDVSTALTTLVEVDVKSGSLDVLELSVPEGLNVLEVSAPSLRHYALSDDEGSGDGQRVLRIELTQPMEGRFRVEVVCERITGHEEELGLPLLSVSGAEVERGRIGVEALAAFQVDAATVERLSAIDPSELPEQLLLRTDNPILHAYRYAQADPAPRLALRITRHQEIETPHAVIDTAAFRTLYTQDGVMVTTARFMLRNRSEQFLRVGLPEGSEVWSASVDGHSQTPALADGTDASEPTVLLNIVSAPDAFPVEIVYATPAPALGAFGRLRGTLPRLDVVVTRTTWEVYLPSGAHYARPDSSMSLVSVGPMAYQDAMPQGALALEVPADGVRYVFEKMYMGRDGQSVGFSMPYVSGWGSPFVSLLSVLGALLLCMALLAFAVLRLGVPLPAAMIARLPVGLATYRDNERVIIPGSGGVHRRALLASFGLGALGVLLLTGTIGYLAASAWPAIGVAGVCALGALGTTLKRARDRWRERALAERPTAPPPAPAAPPPPPPPVSPAE
ncbi:MAG: hypothetical protein AB7S26_18655 [Sandaracinaceae bacterium]